jgi:hypothetical protein
VLPPGCVTWYYMHDIQLSFLPQLVPHTENKLGGNHGNQAGTRPFDNWQKGVIRGTWMHGIKSQQISNYTHFLLNTMALLCNLSCTTSYFVLILYDVTTSLYQMWRVYFEWLNGYNHKDVSCRKQPRGRHIVTLHSEEALLTKSSAFFQKVRPHITAAQQRKWL